MKSRWSLPSFLLVVWAKEAVLVQYPSQTHLAVVALRGPLGCIVLCKPWPQGCKLAWEDAQCQYKYSKRWCCSRRLRHHHCLHSYKEPRPRLVYERGGHLAGTALLIEIQKYSASIAHAEQCCCCCWCSSSDHISVVDVVVFWAAHSCCCCGILFWSKVDGC
jgi:hypothetical protein